MPEVFPVCAVTRAMARRGTTEADEVVQEDQDLGVLFAEPCEPENYQDIRDKGKAEDHIAPKVLYENR